MEYKIIKQDMSSAQGKVVIEERESREGEPEKVLVKAKTMLKVVYDYDCWFDRYGNLCSEHGHLAPYSFCCLGEEFHVTKGCGWDIDNDWLKVKE